MTLIQVWDTVELDLWSPKVILNSKQTANPVHLGIGFCQVPCLRVSTVRQNNAAGNSSISRLKR